MSLYLNLSNIWGWGWIEGEDHRGEVTFSSHNIKGTCYQRDLSLMMLMLTLIT